VCCLLPVQQAAQLWPLDAPLIRCERACRGRRALSCRSVREILAALDAGRGSGGAGGAPSSKASSSSSIAALDALPAPAGLEQAGRGGSASSSPRPAYEPARITPSATSKMAPPAKATTLVRSCLRGQSDGPSCRHAQNIRERRCQTGVTVTLSWVAGGCIQPGRGRASACCRAACRSECGCGRHLRLQAHQPWCARLQWLRQGYHR
jgi:hypothetical protein